MVTISQQAVSHFNIAHIDLFWFRPVIQMKALMQKRDMKKVKQELQVKRNQNYWLITLSLTPCCVVYVRLDDVK